MQVLSPTYLNNYNLSTCYKPIDNRCDIRACLTLLLILIIYLKIKQKTNIKHALDFYTHILHYMLI